MITNNNKTTVLIINGPNLNFVGIREPHIYGNQTFDKYIIKLKKDFNININYIQTNIEGEIIDHLHNAINKYNAVIINAGGYTHTSVAIRDAIAILTKDYKIPVIEVHISNIFNRETFRQKSLIAPVVNGSISGFGLNSYKLALHYIIDLFNN